MTAVDTETTRWGPLPATAPGLSASQRREVCLDLASTLRWDHLRRAGERCWEIVRREDDYEAWLIAWPPGGRVRYHDHGPSSGSVLVLEGALLELTPRLRGDDQLRLERYRYAAGSLLEFDPGHVHDLLNEGGGLSVSLHVYSPRLECMTYFDLGPRGIIERETVRSDDEVWLRHLP